MLPPVGTADSEVTVNENKAEVKSELQDQLDEKRENEVKENENVISSGTSSSDDVADALEAIDKTKELQADEKSVSEALNEAGYDKVFVEIQGSTIKITVTKKDASNDDAVAIMNIVYSKTSKKYTPEIKFVSE